MTMSWTEGGGGGGLALVGGISKDKEGDSQESDIKIKGKFCVCEKLIEDQTVEWILMKTK